MKKIIAYLCFVGLVYGQSPAQDNLYISGSGIGGYVLGQFNVGTCEVCTEFFIPNSEAVPGGMSDVVAMPNGQVVVIWFYDEIYIYDPPSSTPVSMFSPPGNISFGGGILAPNGDVDLTDPCLKISDVLEIIWHPLPTVTFSTSNTNVCADNCYEIEVDFTGTAPFTLTYTTPAGGSITETFPGNMGIFQVCIPSGTVPGDWEVQATALTDGYCDCN